MADYVAGSLVKGDPVLVHGRVSMRDWATETKSGRSVEVVADHIGHDLRFGTSAFKRPGRAPAVAPIDEVPLPTEPPATEDTFAA
jgi:single-strand DNA-binding protein